MAGWLTPCVARQQSGWTPTGGNKHFCGLLYDAREKTVYFFNSLGKIQEGACAEVRGGERAPATAAVACWLFDVPCTQVHATTLD